MSASFTHHGFDTIHRRFGHCGHRRIRRMVSRSRNFSNFNGTFEHDPASCDACMAGGGKKKPFPRRASQQFTYFGQRLSSILHHLHVSTLHTDNGGEFLKADLDAFCEESATRRSFSVPCCPPQNASAERRCGVLLTIVRTAS